MDINLLPLEVLQDILWYLSYDELKVVSLVCRRWNQASETFIVRNGQLRIDKEVIANLDVIRKSSTLRNYQAICIARMDDWLQLQVVVSECVQRFPYVRELYLRNIVPDHFNRFCQAWKSWMKTLESLYISLKDNRSLELLLGDLCLGGLFLGELKDVILELPNLKKLRWTEGMTGIGQKIVTINAPRLEHIYFNDYDSCNSILRIAHCEQIKHINATFNRNHFDDLFQEVTFNVESLKLKVRFGCNFSCLPDMHQLRYLSLDIGRGTRNLLKEVEAMQCSKLEDLSISKHCSDSDSDDRGTLNLKQVFGNFKNLKTLDLFGIDLTANGEIQADQLVSVKLNSVTITTCSRSIELNAPKLRTLAMPVHTLGYLHLNKSEQLSDIRLDLKSSDLMESFEQIILPFINDSRAYDITLALMRHDDAEKLDDVIYDGGGAELILYNMNVDIYFFRLLAGWKSLMRLKLITCSINCSSMPDDVFRLPGVRWMKIDRVMVFGRPSRTDFPIYLVSGFNDELVGEWLGSGYCFDDCLPY